VTTLENYTLEMNMSSDSLTQEEAQALYDAFDIGCVLDDEEEYELLEESNPILLDAYIKIENIAIGET